MRLLSRFEAKGYINSLTLSLCSLFSVSHRSSQATASQRYNSTQPTLPIQIFLSEHLLMGWSSFTKKFNTHASGTLGYVLKAQCLIVITSLTFSQ
jgi:hypothetical protein